MNFLISGTSRSWQLTSLDRWSSSIGHHVLNILCSLPLLLRAIGVTAAASGSPRRRVDERMAMMATARLEQRTRQLEGEREEHSLPRPTWPT